MDKTRKLGHHLVGIAAALLALVWFMNLDGSHVADAPRAGVGTSVKNVALDDAKALFDAGAVVIDVRSREAFEARHIPGALNVPLEQLRQGIPAEIEAARGADIVVYCNEGTARGHDSTALLNQAGFSKAVNLRSGIEGWTRSGLPVQVRGS